MRDYVFLFSFFFLAIARLYPPPNGVFRSFFRPPVTKTTCQLTFSLSGGANKSCSTLFDVHWPRLTKRFDSFRSFLRFWTLIMLWGAKRRIFMKNSQSEFLILKPLCEKSEKWFFSRDSKGSQNMDMDGCNGISNFRIYEKKHSISPPSISHYRGLF